MRHATRWLAAIALGVLAPTTANIALAAAPVTRPARDALATEIARLAAQTDGTVGVAMRRVGGGPQTALNAATTFPMASTFKIAVAGAILAKVDRGELALDRLIAVDPALYVASDGIAQQVPHPGVSLSLLNLLELMLTRSDNTATDVLTAQAGGPAAVTAWLRAQGIRDQRVDADTARLIFRALDITPGTGTFRQQVDAAFAADPAKRERDVKRIPNRAFNADPRDASTPAAMVDLLLRIQSGRALSPASTTLLLEIMQRCITGQKRLKGLLPAGTPVAHKTGTLMSIANDVGLVTLPDGTKFAIAVFVKDDTKGYDTQERVIADIARLAYDYYLLGGE